MTPFSAPCRVLDLPGHTLLVLPPEIDLSNASALCADALACAQDRAGRLETLVLDLTRTDFMDSQGARLVEDVRRGLPPDVRLLVVAAPDGVPYRVLELTGVRRDVPVHGDLTGALRA